MADLEFALPDEIYAKLEVRAAIAGMSIESYVLERFEGDAAVPSEDEMRERVCNLPPWPMCRIIAPLDLLA